MFTRRLIPFVALMLVLLMGLLWPMSNAQASPPLDRVPILLYHHIDYTFGAWHVRPDKLNSELCYLVANGFHTISMQSYLDAREGRGTLPAKPIILTFDDGDRGRVRKRLSTAQKISSGRHVLHHYGRGWQSGLSELGADPAMQQAGMEIGAHTVHHLMLTKLSALRAFVEILFSRLTLELHLMTPITTFAYPEQRPQRSGRRAGQACRVPKRRHRIALYR